MEGFFARDILAWSYSDDLVGIAFTADCLQSDIFSACGRYARRHRLRASVPKCGVMPWSVILLLVVLLCRPSPLGPSMGPHGYLQGVEVQTFGCHHGTAEYAHQAGHDPEKCACIADGEATAQQALICARQAYACLALRLWLGSGAEVLVSTGEHARALKSVQLEACRMILSCPSESLFDVTMADPSNAAVALLQTLCKAHVAAKTA